MTTPTPRVPSPPPPAAAPAAAIAVIGIGCRFPGQADDPHTLWRNLLAGADSVGEVPAARWNADRHFHPQRGLAGKTASRWGGFVDDIDGFDAEFFNISPREAALMDPQQRMLLEVCWQALEDGGQLPAQLRGSAVGVFMGGFTLDYMLMQLGGTEYRAVEPHTATGSVMTMLANRLSYVFGFQGPSMALDTACSSSLVAIHLACQSLASGESTLAVAGGVNALLGPSYTIAESRAGMLSPTGRSRAFDARADGYVRGEGAGIVVLKRLDEALADGDHIYSVIRATAVNQDGHSDGLTVPSGDAQQALIARACAAAGVQPGQVAYVEAHGTGTPVGDPIEANAIGRALGAGRATGQPCLLGSIKTNIGHTEAAAGVAGLIKASLVLQHGLVPPHPHFRSRNPKIDLDALNLAIPLAVTALPAHADGACAGVNSFGFGGTNAHAILAAAPARAQPPADADGHAPFMLPLSARHPDALRALGGSFANALDAGGALAGAALRDVAWSAATRREHLPCRACVGAADREELIEALRALAEGRHHARLATQPVAALPPAAGGAGALAPAPVFVFSGMGPQWWGMGQQLLRNEPLFRASAERCAALFDTLAGGAILAQMLATEDTSRMADTDIAQPANFILQVALAELLAAWGVRPAAIIGHSAGEPAAAYVAGCLTLEQAVRVIYHRSHLQHRTAGTGRMLAIGLGQREALAELAALDDPTLTLAAVNGPTQVTIAGGADGIERLRLALEAKRVFARALKVQVPFHSIYMEPLEAPLMAALADLAPSAPTIPLYSTVSGGRVVGAVHDAAYWYHNMRQPVYFADAVNAALAEGHRHFVELAPHPVLAGSLQENAIMHGIAAHVVPTLRRDRDDAVQMRHALGLLFCHGAAIDWAGALPAGLALPLPCYPWRHQRHWYETESSQAHRAGAAEHPILARRLDTDVPTWEADLDRATLGFLQDHCIQGTVVFPGAGYVEMAAHAARCLFGELALTTFANVVFRKALYLAADQALTLRISVDPRTYEFRIASRLFDQPLAAWQLHCTGQLLTGRRAALARQDLDALARRCPGAVTAAECYTHFERLGLEYGPLFRGIESLRRGDDEALARVEVPAALHTTMNQFGIHPALLDLCFQTLAAALPFDGAATVYMPTGVAEGGILAALPQRLWIHAVITGRDAQGMRGNIRMLDDEGALLLEISGCGARALDAAAPFAVTPQRLYQPSWPLAPLAAASAATATSATTMAASMPAAAAAAAAPMSPMSPISPASPASPFSPFLAPSPTVASGRWYVYGGAPELADAVAAEFARRGHSAICLPSSAIAEGGREAWLARINDAGAADLRGVLHLDLCWPPLGDLPSKSDIDADIARGCLVTLHLTQALAALAGPVKPRLWIATRGTQPVLPGDRPDPFRAPVWGMARVLGHGEHIDLWGGIVDLPAAPHGDDARHLVDECLGSGAEDQIAYRDGARHVLRLVDCAPAARLPVPPRLRADASYLITGGLGALGLEVARWMTRHGAGHLVLIGREGLPPRAGWAALAPDHPAAHRVARVLEMEKLGAQVSVEALDISDRAALDAMLERRKAEARPPVRGVIHAAGVAHPRLLTQTGDADFVAVMPAKVLGAWNLHQALADAPLDFFTLFSSVASLVISMGQGNYAAANTFLDALAHRRRADGLPATSINWGPWGDVGMATQLDLLAHFHHRGFYPMTAEQGCEALGWLMSERVTQAVVLGAKWTVVGDTSPLGIAAPMLEQLIAEQRAQDADGVCEDGAAPVDVLAQIAACEDDAAMLNVVSCHVRMVACRVLRIDGAGLAADANISQHGLDSMMAIELKNRLEQSLKVGVAIVDLLRGVSANDIAALVLPQLHDKRVVVHDAAVADIIANLDALSPADRAALLNDLTNQESSK
ncbi:MAG TPA: type I polyketide synthase [Duganella sp.]